MFWRNNFGKSRLRSLEVGNATTKNGRRKRRNVVCILSLKVVQKLEAWGMVLECCVNWVKRRKTEWWLLLTEQLDRLGSYILRSKAMFGRTSDSIFALISHRSSSGLPINDRAFFPLTTQCTRPWKFPACGVGCRKPKLAIYEVTWQSTAWSLVVVRQGQLSIGWGYQRPY